MNMEMVRGEWKRIFISNTDTLESEKGEKYEFIK